MKHSFSYGIDLAKNSQKSTMVEFETNVIHQTNLIAKTLEPLKNIILKKKSALPVSCLWNRRPLKVQNDNQIDP